MTKQETAIMFAAMKELADSNNIDGLKKVIDIAVEESLSRDYNDYGKGKATGKSKED